MPLMLVSASYMQLQQQHRREQAVGKLTVTLVAYHVHKAAATAQSH